MRSIVTGLLLMCAFTAAGQQRMEDLRSIWGLSRGMSMVQVRKALASHGFSGDDVRVSPEGNLLLVRKPSFEGLVFDYCAMSFSEGALYRVEFKKVYEDEAGAKTDFRILVRMLKLLYVPVPTEFAGGNAGGMGSAVWRDGQSALAVELPLHEAPYVITMMHYTNK